MSKGHLFKISLLIILAYVSEQQCKMSLSESKLVTGTIQFTPQTKSQSIAVVMKAQKLQSGISLINKGPNYYSLTSSTISPSSIQFTIFCSQAIFSLQASYIISGDPFIHIHSFVFDTTSSLSGQRLFSQIAYLPPQLNLQQTYLTGFISGVRTNTPILSLSFTTQILLRHLQFNLTLSSPVHFIQLTYILLGGGYRLYFQNGISRRGQYNWMGGNGYRSSELEVSTIAIFDKISVCIGSSLCQDNPCVGEQFCKAASGVLSNNFCVVCPPYYVYRGGGCKCDPRYAYQVDSLCKPCWSNSIGVPDLSTCVCALGYYATNDKTCVKDQPCTDPNTAFNHQLQSCVCKDTFIATPDSSCILRSNCNAPNTFIQNQVCKCRDRTKVLVGGECVCGKDLVYSIQLQKCICSESNSIYILNACSKCGDNALPDGALTQCVCITGYYPLNNSCTPIPPCCNDNVYSSCYFDVDKGECGCTDPKQKYNSDNKTCTCPQNQYYDLSLSSCSCNASYYMSHGLCVRCWDNSVQSQGKEWCDCLPTHYADAIGSCKLIPTCKDKQILIDYVCRCPQGSVLTNSICTICPTNSQPDDSNDSNTVCKCITGYYSAKGDPLNCVVAPNCTAPDSYYDNSVQSCQCLYKGQQYNSDKGCACPANTHLGSNACVCDDNYYFKGNKCQECWANSHGDNVRSTCICNQGYYESANGSSYACNAIKVTQSCAEDYGDGLQSGKQAFASKIPYNEKSSTLIIPIKLTSTTIEHFATAVGSSTDFQVSTSTVDGKNLIITLQVDSGWVLITVHYMMSINRYFQMGTFTLDVSQYKLNNNGAYIYEGQTKQSLHSSNLVVFITGLRTQSSIKQLSISGLTKNNSIAVTVTVYSFSALSYLKVSYIASLSNSPFEIEFAKSQDRQYHMKGVTSVVFGSLASHTVSIVMERKNCVGVSCNSSCISQADCLAQNGGIVNKNCYLCDVNQFFDSQACTCDQKSILVGTSCRLCPTGQSLNKAYQVCN